MLNSLSVEMCHIQQLHSVFFLTYMLKSSVDYLKAPLFLKQKLADVFPVLNNSLNKILNLQELENSKKTGRNRILDVNTELQAMGTFKSLKRNTDPFLRIRFFTNLILYKLHSLWTTLYSDFSVTLCFS